ncbi:hypothetical protein [Streptomyces sp. NPDC005181]|uniref:hypothetical protein n=1 Tax=Streptomyces sp. NPDC005181 TaxID=3156869 RepID=UPI00339E7D0B
MTPERNCRLLIFVIFQGGVRKVLIDIPEAYEVHLNFDVTRLAPDAAPEAEAA